MIKKSLVVSGVLNAPSYVYHNGDFKWCAAIHLIGDYPKDRTPNKNLSTDPRFEIHWVQDFLGKDGGYVVSNVQPGEYTNILQFSWDSLCYGSGAAKKHMTIPSPARWGAVSKTGDIAMATPEEVESYYHCLRQAVRTHLMELSYGTPGPACGLPQAIDHPLTRWVKGYEDLHWSGQAGAMGSSLFTDCAGDSDWNPRWWDDEHFAKMIFTGAMPNNYCPAVNAPIDWETQQNKSLPIESTIPCENEWGYVRFLYELREKISKHFNGSGITLELRPNGRCRFTYEGMGIAMACFAGDTALLQTIPELKSLHEQSQHA